jgi:HEAT repeat protein
MDARANAIAEFMDEVRSENFSTRFAAVACLGGIKAVEAIEIITTVLCDASEDKLIRLRAVTALGEIGPPASKAVRAVIDNYDEEYCEIYCDALHAIGTEEALAFAELHRHRVK